MNKEICEKCPDQNTEVCESCEKRKCRVCGCTWNNACPGGCYWVEFDLCSTCAGIEPVLSRLTYTFEVNYSPFGLDSLLEILNEGVQITTGCEIIRSRLESPDEICEMGEWDTN